MSTAAPDLLHHTPHLAETLGALLRDRAGLDAGDVRAVQAFVGLLADSPDDASAPELARRVVAHQEVAAVLAGASAPWQAAWDASLDWAADGARSAASWLQTRATVSRSVAAGQLRTARTMRATPIVAAASRSGRLGAEKTRLLLGARTPATAAAFAEHEAWLVDTAAGLTVEGARTFLDQWKNAADPDGPAPRDRTTSHLHLSPTPDAGLRVDGHLAALDAATVLDAITARIDAWHRAGLLADDQRSRSELHAAALAEICGADASVPVRRRPTVLVHVGADALAGQAAALRPCDLPGHGVIHPTTARRLACHGDLQRVVTDAAGEVLELGMAVRLASPAQRKALIVRSRGHCEYPGCDAPHHWCEAHHVDPFRADPAHPHGGTGPTDLSNLALLCSRHHHCVHEGGHRLARGPDGWKATRPDGRAVEPRFRAEPC